MSITLTGGTGLFDRWGKWLYLLAKINARFGQLNADDFAKEANDALIVYDGEVIDVRTVIDSAADDFATFQDAPRTYRAAIKTYCQDTLVKMAYRDNPLAVKDVATAYAELRRQMIDAAQTVDANEPTITSLVSGPRTGVITGATKANPCVITSAAHGLSNGDVVSIASVGGMVEINNLEFTVSGVTTNTFQLNGINSTGYTNYTTGGRWHANVGNPAIIISLLDGQGATLENAFAEDLTWSVSSNSTAGSESISVAGEYAQSDTMRHDWPLGSGASKSLSVQSPDTGNKLTNGNFEAFTANAPDSWTIVAGSAGSTIKSNASSYRGSLALEFVGDGATLCQITQALTGLSSRTPYPVSIRYKLDVVPAAGVLVIDLYDGTNVILDDKGNSNTLTIPLTTGTTTYRVATAAFRLPEKVPATVTLRLRLTTAITAGSSALLDDLIFGSTAMAQLYNAGPFVGFTAGAKALGLSDGGTITVANDYRGAFQQAIHRLLGIPDKPAPSATGGAETISDGLIA